MVSDEGVDTVAPGVPADGRGGANSLNSAVPAEINVDPPNPASDRFHQAFGFVEVGSAFLADRAKTVRYLALSI